MAIKYFKHFVRSDDKIRSAGISFSGEVERTAREKLISILNSKQLQGSPHKGYFFREGMPSSVSFTSERMGNLAKFFETYGHYGIAINAERLKDKIKPVLYLTDEQISSKEYVEKDKWRVDVLRPDSIYEEGHYTGETHLRKKRHDFSWEKEWRMKCTVATFDKTDFVFVSNKDECRRINERFGQEAYDVSSHIARINDWKKSVNAPIKLEDTLYEEITRLGKEKPHELVMQEATEVTWDRIKKEATIIVK